MYDDRRAHLRGRLPDLTTRPPRRHPGARLALVVVAASAVGIAAALYLLPKAHKAPATPATTVARATATSSPAAPVAAQTGSAYRLLPLSAAQIADAATVATSFTTAFGTYSYTQPAAAYLATLRPYATSALLTELTQAATTPGLQHLRVQQHASATATATIDIIRDIAGTTITFIVTAREATQSQGRAGSTTTQYAVTVAPSSSSWQVYDIEPASAGQAGTSP